MLIVRHKYQTITEDVHEFELDGMFEPKIYNVGSVDMQVNGLPIPADGSYYDASFTGAQSVGKLDIVFDSGPGVKKAVCIFGTVQGDKEVPPSDQC